METIYLFRYERSYCQSYEGFPGLYNAKISLDKYLVTKKTQKGCWLENGRFVLNDAKKRFAYPTPEQALVNFIKRTQTCCTIQESQLDKSKAYLSAAKNHKAGLEDLNEFTLTTY